MHLVDVGHLPNLSVSLHGGDHDPRVYAEQEGDADVHDNGEILEDPLSWGGEFEDDIGEEHDDVVHAANDNGRLGCDSV